MEGLQSPELMPLFSEVKQLKCNNCGYTFEDIASTGKLGCGNCYEVFEERLDPIIRRIQGDNHHIGRVGKIIDNKIEQKLNKKTEKEPKENNLENQIENLQEKLKQVIKEEKYEEAAKIRDEIKKLEKGN